MRLVTRSDFDGLMCAVLLKDVEDIQEIVFAHPKDVQDGKFHITSEDIITNLPYDPNCGMWFDHHSSEEERVDVGENFKGDFRVAPSAARVVYDYYGEEKLGKYGKVMEEVDKVDAAQLTVEDVTNPKGWILLSYVMDPRTGLGKYHHFRISNYQLMLKMVDLIADHSVAEILEMPDVKERVELYLEQNKAFHAHLKEYSKVDGNVIVTDVRGQDDIPTGNRFLVYTVFPEANVSVRISDGFRKQNTVVAVGHSIFNRTCKTDVGGLMSNFGGGGHKGAGTCQLDNETADSQAAEIIDALKSNG